MALPSFFKRKTPQAPASVAPDALSDETGPVQAARAQARRRLIGAVVLLAIGVLAFPMLFETQPRPLPQDIPIELPRRDAALAKAPAMPPSLPTVTELPVTEPAAAPAASVPALVAETPSSSPARPAAASAPQPAADSVSSAKAASVSASAPAPVAAAASDAKAGRFVVQVGAYTDAGTLRDVRAKVEKLGLKTYTQSVDTDAGVRTRVRVGPFSSRQEAESASGKLKAAGLPGNVLVL